MTPGPDGFEFHYFGVSAGYDYGITDDGRWYRYEPGTDPKTTGVEVDFLDIPPFASGKTEKQQRREHRDLFIYTMCLRRDKEEESYASIRSKVNATPGWPRLESDAGVWLAVVRFCKKRNIKLQRRKG
jgi:hypothetical protein